MNIGIVSPFNPYCVKDYLLVNNVPILHNGATAVNTLVLSFLQEGHSVCVFTSDLSISETTLLQGKRIKIYIMPAMLHTKIKWFKHKLMMDQFYMPGRIASVIKKEIASLDVLHAHWTYEYASAAKLFAHIKPVFVTVRDWAPYIYSMQKTFHQKAIWRFRYNTFLKLMRSSNLHFIANSQYTYNHIISEYPDKNVDIIHNSINEKYIITHRRKKPLHHQFISIAQSLDDNYKNIVTLLQAFREYGKKYPQACLHLVGMYNPNGTNYSHWKELGLLKNVIFHGPLLHSEIFSIMDNMSCLIHPSLEETFGNIILEAMARGIPCIGGEDSGAVPYVLGFGKYGLICNVKDATAIESSMEKLLKDDFVKQLVSSATDMLINTYSSKAIVKKHIELYYRYL